MVEIVDMKTGQPANEAVYIEIMQSLGMSEEYAIFAYAMATGKIDGDVIDIDDEKKSAA